MPHQVDPPRFGAWGNAWRRTNWRLRATLTASLVVAATLLGFAGGPASAQEPSPAWDVPPGSKVVAGLFFDILRNDQHIGTAHVEMFDAGGAWEVRSRTEVFIKIGPAILYDFFQRVRATWRNGRLISFYANTDDNGVEKRIAFKAGAQGSLLISDGKSVAVSSDIAPTSFWEVSMLEREQFFDPMLGLLHDVKVSDKSEAKIKVRGKSIKTSYYTITGDIQRKLWYLENGTLVQLSLTARDGSEVLYKLK